MRPSSSELVMNCSGGFIADAVYGMLNLWRMAQAMRGEPIAVEIGVI